jgi:hypothetical protein
LPIPKKRILIIITTWVPGKIVFEAEFRTAQRASSFSFSASSSVLFLFFVFIFFSFFFFFFLLFSCSRCSREDKEARRVLEVYENLLRRLERLFPFFPAVEKNLRPLLCLIWSAAASEWGGREDRQGPLMQERARKVEDGEVSKKKKEKKKKKKKKIDQKRNSFMRS